MMSPFLRFEFEKIAKYFRTRTLAKSITSILFVLVFLFVGMGIYYFFVSGFRYINGEAVEEIRLALTLFLYEVFLLVLAGIIIFSSIISSIFNLFRGEYNNWVISSPGYRMFPRLVFVRSLFSSAVPSLIMFLPAVLAFNKVNHLGFLSLVFILLSVVLFLILLNALTLISVLVVSFLYYKISQKVKAIKFNFKGLVALVILIASGIFYFVWKTVSDIDLVKLFRADEDSHILSVENIGNYFNSLPTHPFALEIVNWQNGQLVDALFNFSLLLVFAMIATLVFWYLSFLFYPLWQKFQEGGSQITAKTVSIFGNGLVYRFTGGRTVALFKKEALISSRNFKGILWFLFLFSIWFMQVLTNVLLGKNIRIHQPDISTRLAVLQSLQFIIALYFMAAFTLRFVFPSFSVEKKTSWILASAPLSFRKIFFGKYLFYTSFFVIVGVLMSYININVLNLSFTHAFYSILLLVSNIIFIVTLGLSLGAIFPNSETDDPEVISTSMPGLFFTALSLIYGALSAFTLYITLITKDVSWLLVLVVTTLILVGIALLKVPNYVEKRVS